MTTLKRYLISSLDTFLAAFAVAIAPFLTTIEGNLDWPTLKATLIAGGIAGLVAGVRAVIKASREIFMRRFIEEKATLYEVVEYNGKFFRFSKDNGKLQHSNDNVNFTDVDVSIYDNPTFQSGQVFIGGAMVKESSNPKPMKKKGGKKC